MKEAYYLGSLGASSAALKIYDISLCAYIHVALG